uniref:DDE Tnp4 domain-containing protein n=1 Tax=Plectus sambesii TaxID=2011161 RepID=A0A914WUG6_9BILA
MIAFATKIGDTKEEDEYERIGRRIADMLRKVHPDMVDELALKLQHTCILVLMGVAGPDYRYILADIGAPAGANDSGVFGLTSFGRDLHNGRAHLPAGEYKLPLSSTQARVPYMLVGDAAFPLLPHLMKPHPAANRTMAQRIFDYRLSRSQRVVENAFRLLATRWRVLRKPITTEPPFATKIVHACICLHNWLLECKCGAYLGRLSEGGRGHSGEEEEWRAQSLELRRAVHASANNLVVTRKMCAMC